jgi:hypothetical protein
MERLDQRAAFQRRRPEVPDRASRFLERRPRLLLGRAQLTLGPRRIDRERAAPPGAAWSG